MRRRRGGGGWAAGALALALAGAPCPAAAQAEAEAVLEAPLPARPGLVPEAAPPRFLLLEDGTVYVGGVKAVFAGRLAPRELKQLRKRLDFVRGQRGLPSAVSFGAGEGTWRLRLKRGFSVVATGDPENAPVPVRALAELVRDLAAFGHPSLQPWTPASFLLQAREGRLEGGCRAWRRPGSLAGLVTAPAVVGAAEASGWPTGAEAAFVCADGRTWLVTHRPLLPGERP